MVETTQIGFVIEKRFNMYIYNYSRNRSHLWVPLQSWRLKHDGRRLCDRDAVDETVHAAHGDDLPEDGWIHDQEVGDGRQRAQVYPVVDRRNIAAEQINI